ncbi:Rha family transcriptional regulator [Paenalkalicoccus suaedae]|uniref:Rha family transcriptional regulator n=1 Tax=Paenalkalicoccus suaedae TaxID=2592382 RepID=A0A859FBW4_9BACI|nr:Rha family transcriptional regulator [Paenalkalicoccus suaedae]QKS70221.1 Rha family transcriptional regulator [Paenalkalicoccus suaedae]
MQELVYEKDGMVVTDSLTLAAAFEKGHDKVLRDIRNIKCSEAFKNEHFAEFVYKNKQGREMPMYYLTYEGFVFVAMSYTGSRAAELKEDFILNFGNRVKQLASSQPDMKHLEATYTDAITIKSDKQRVIQVAVRNRVYEQYGHISDSARRKYFALMYQQIRKEFGVLSYRDLREKDFQRALNFIDKSTLQIITSQ